MNQKSKLTSLAGGAAHDPGSIDQNYCSYSQLELDPLLRKLRFTPAYDKLLKSAKECQQAATSAAPPPLVQ